MPDLDCDQVAIVGLVQGGDCSPPSITTDLLFVVVVLGRRAQGLPKRRKEGERERDAAVLSTAVAGTWLGMAASVGLCGRAGDWLDAWGQPRFMFPSESRYIVVA